MLAKVKIYLRKFKADVLDEEIQDLIDAAKADLSLCGIIKLDETDALIKRAITCYCKAYFGYENKEADRFKESYESLRQHLALSSEYTVADVVVV